MYLNSALNYANHLLNSQPYLLFAKQNVYLYVVHCKTKVGLHSRQLKTNSRMKRLSFRAEENQAFPVIKERS